MEFNLTENSTLTNISFIEHYSYRGFNRAVIKDLEKNKHSFKAGRCGAGSQLLDNTV